MNYTKKINKENLFRFYETLIKHSKIKDAVLFHSIHFFGLEPNHLCLLKLELIKDDKTIETWDHKSRKFIFIINISNNL